MLKIKRLNFNYFLCLRDIFFYLRKKWVRKEGKKKNFDWSVHQDYGGSCLLFARPIKVFYRKGRIPTPVIDWTINQWFFFWMSQSGGLDFFFLFSSMAFRNFWREVPCVRQKNLICRTFTGKKNESDKKNRKINMEQILGVAYCKICGIVVVFIAL